MKIAALWARFRYRAIGSTIKISCDAKNYEYWLQCMRDRYARIRTRHDLRFSAYVSWCQELEGIGLDLNTIRTETETHTEQEDLPDVAGLTSDDWLSNRNNVRSTYRGGAGLSSALIRQWMDEVPDPSEDFAAEFDDLFYWGFR